MRVVSRSLFPSKGCSFRQALLVTALDDLGDTLVSKWSDIHYRTNIESSYLINLVTDILLDITDHIMCQRMYVPGDRSRYLQVPLYVAKKGNIADACDDEK